ncbi:MAG: hypothetical protein ACREQQ_02775 [Candidatus Binatia bacterium]
MLHWLILIPYYFVGALVLCGLLAVVSRLLRLPVTMERIVAVSVFGSIGALAVLLGSGVVRIDDLGIVPILVLGVASFVLAGVDAVLVPARPLTSEGSARHHSGDPQVF